IHVGATPGFVARPRLGQHWPARGRSRLSTSDRFYGLRSQAVVGPARVGGTCTVQRPGPAAGPLPDGEQRQHVDGLSGPGPALNPRRGQCDAIRADPGGARDGHARADDTRADDTWADYARADDTRA